MSVVGVGLRVDGWMTVMVMVGGSGKRRTCELG